MIDNTGTLSAGTLCMEGPDGDGEEGPATLRHNDKLRTTTVNVGKILLSEICFISVSREVVQHQI